MYNDVKDKFDLKTDKEVICKMISLTNAKIMYKYFPFGKYKDMPMEQFVEENYYYANSLLEDDETSEDMKYSLFHFVEKHKNSPPKMIQEFPFGKHKGIKMREFVRDNKYYAEKLVQDPTTEKNLQHTLYQIMYV